MRSFSGAKSDTETYIILGNNIVRTLYFVDNIETSAWGALVDIRTNRFALISIKSTFLHLLS